MPCWRKKEEFVIFHTICYTIHIVFLGGEGLKVPLNTLGLAHAFVKAHVKAGDNVIDATAGSRSQHERASEGRWV